MTLKPLLRVSRVALGAAIFVTGPAAQRDQPYRVSLRADHAAIAYDAGPFEDPIARLGEAVAAGAATLDYDDRFGYLPNLLDRLDTRVDSHVLVFSKTSFQAEKISPRHPRAIYFNDDAAVGIIHAADVIELAAFGSRRGGVFYTPDARRSDRPRFARPPARPAVCDATRGPPRSAYRAPTSAPSRPAPRADPTSGLAPWSPTTRPGAGLGLRTAVRSVDR